MQRKLLTHAMAINPKGGTQGSFIRVGSVLERSNPLPFYIAFLTENWYFFPIPSVKKWYSFHILSISFNC